MDATIYIAVNAELLRLGISQVIVQSGLTIVEEDRVCADLGDRILATAPSIVIASWGEPGFNYKSEFKRIKKALPDTKFLLLLENPEQFDEAFKTKADGYLVESTSAYLFPVAIQALLEFGGWLGPAIANYVIKKSPGRRAFFQHKADSAIAKLTGKESQVLQLMSDGMDIDQIATELGMSVETVRVHCKHINKKLNVRDRAQAVAMILRSKL